MMTLTNLILARPLRIQSTRSPASAAQRIRARVHLRSENLTRRRCILGEVSPERIHLAAIEPDDPDCFAPLVVGHLVSESTTDPDGPQSSFYGYLRLSGWMRLLFLAFLILGLALMVGALMVLLSAPSTSAFFPLFLSIPVLGASFVALSSIDERIRNGVDQLEQLLRESLAAPLLPAERPTDPPRTLVAKRIEKSAASTKPAAA